MGSFQSLPHADHSRRRLALYLGADKTGSTWVYETLRRSPAVATPRAKEAFFFDRYHQRGIEWYLATFDAKHEEVLLDVTHDYVFSSEALDRVGAAPLPTRFIVLLRDPGRRAYSAYRFMQSQGRIRNDLTFGEAVRAVDELIDHGRYAHYLRPWVARFGREAFFVSPFSRLSEGNATTLAADLMAWLDLPPLPKELSGPVNEARSARSATAVRVGRRVASALRGARLEGSVQRAKDSSLVRRALFRHGSPAPTAADLLIVDRINVELGADRRSLLELFGVTWP